MEKKENNGKASVAILSKLLAAYGVRHIVVSPGSRCAPLTVAFNRSGAFKLHPVIDERSAAFVALGIALATKEPVAMVCTSGTAPLNYAPALAEAYYRRVPLIAISADRPASAVDQRQGQTIHQAHALDVVVRKSIDLGVDINLNFANRLINEALSEATGIITGPVHINVQLAEPLCPDELAENIPWHKIEVKAPSSAIEPHLASVPLIIIGGVHFTESDLQALQSYRERSGALVLAEVQSNIPGAIAPALIDFDKFEAPEEILIFGGDIVDKRLRQWLESLENTRFISVGFEDGICDTFGHLSVHVQASPAAYLDSMRVREKQNRNLPLLSLEESVLQPIADVFKEGDVFISNGSSIRKAQTARWSPDVCIDCNRGTSGIEGSMSTAIGSAIVSGRPTLLITGDMSAAYDISPLSLRNIPHTFKMVVLDNNGGDIFRHITSTSRLPELEAYFAMPPQLPLQALASAYCFSFHTDLKSFISDSHRAILHIKC